MDYGILGQSPPPKKAELKRAPSLAPPSAPPVIAPPPESHASLYVGIGIAVLVVGVGAYLITK